MIDVLAQLNLFYPGSNRPYYLANNRFTLEGITEVADWEHSSSIGAVFSWVADHLVPDQIVQLRLRSTAEHNWDLYGGLVGTSDPLAITAHLRYTVEDGVKPSDLPVWRSCSRCGETHEATPEYFYRRGEGWSSWCIECHRSYSRVRRSLKKHGRRFGVEIEFSLPGLSGSEPEWCDECETYHYEGGEDYSDIKATIVNRLDEAGITCFDDGYSHEVRTDAWKLVPDGSLEAGMELVSPPLRWADAHQIETVCRVLHEIGAVADYQCGLHVHHEIAEFTLPAFQRLYANWSVWQEHIDAFVSPSRRNGRWCSHLDNHACEQVRTLTQLGQLNTLGLDRYFALNVSCYPSYGTVEIRQHQGTLDARKILAWVAFGQAIIEASAGRDMWGNPFDDPDDFLRQLPFRLQEAPYRTFLLERRRELSPRAADLVTA